MAIISYNIKMMLGCYADHVFSIWIGICQNLFNKFILIQFLKFYFFEEKLIIDEKSLKELAF